MIKPQEESIYDLIINAGLQDDWLDRSGSTQVAPTPQLYEFNEDSLADDERCVLIKNTGGGVGNYLVREPAMSIIVFSKNQRGDISVPRDYIERIKVYISTNYDIDCIMAVNIIGDVSGPYRLQSNRRYFELNLNVITDTGEV